MEVMSYIYLFFIFTSLFVTMIFLLLFIRNRRTIFEEKPLTIFPKVSIVIPAYNEGKAIAETIKSVQALEYPREQVEIIVVDDASTDNTYEVAKSFKGVKVIHRDTRSGSAARAKNYGAKYATGEFIGFIDADTSLHPESLRRVISRFDPDIDAVTSAGLAKRPRNLIERMQAIEYAVIAWTRKMLDYMDSVYVTPGGSLSIFRRAVFNELGGYDENNWTEDIEIAWKFLNAKKKIRMCFSGRAYSVVPSTLAGWWKQRTRWNIGGMQTMYKYGKSTFDEKKGMFGMFVVPFVLSFYILTMLSTSIMVYLVIRTTSSIIQIISNIAVTSAPPFQVAKMYLTPSVFLFFGLALFILSLAYAAMAIKTVKGRMLEWKSPTFLLPIDVLIYLTLYLLLYPPVLIYSLYKMAIGDLRWYK